MLSKQTVVCSNTNTISNINNDCNPHDRVQNNLNWLVSTDNCKFPMESIAQCSNSKRLRTEMSLAARMVIPQIFHGFSIQYKEDCKTYMIGNGLDTYTCNKKDNMNKYSERFYIISNQSISLIIGYASQYTRQGGFRLNDVASIIAKYYDGDTCYIENDHRRRRNCRVSPMLFVNLQGIRTSMTTCTHKNNHGNKNDKLIQLSVTLMQKNKPALSSNNFTIGLIGIRTDLVDNENPNRYLTIDNLSKICVENGV